MQVAEAAILIPYIQNYMDPFGTGSERKSKTGMPKQHQDETWNLLLIVVETIPILYCGERARLAVVGHEDALFEPHLPLTAEARSPLGGGSVWRRQVLGGDQGGDGGA